MKTHPFPQEHQGRLLFKCLALSLAVHASVLTVFYYNPLILQKTLGSLFGLSSTTPTLLEGEEEADLAQKNQLLDDVFKQIVVLSPHFQQPYDLAELPKGIALAPNQEAASFEFSARKENIETANRDFTLTSSDWISPQEEMNTPDLFLPSKHDLPIASQLQIDSPLAIPDLPLVLNAPNIEIAAYEDLMSISDVNLSVSFEADYALNLSPQLVSPNSLKIGEDLKLKTDTQPMSAHVASRDLHLDNELVRSTLFIPKFSTGTIEKKQMAIASSQNDLDQYDFPPMATAAEWNDDFDADVVFLPNPEGHGYIFSVALKANFDISAHSLKQNIYFILDRSDSVQKHRFAVFKRAVLKALSSMQHTDTFNILVIDKKITRFSAANNPVTMKNIQAAEEFLDRQEAGGLFSAGEIYISLEKILAYIPNDTEIHTAILLTDGKTNMSASRRQAVLKRFVESNHGRLSVYTAAIGRDNDLLALDMLSSVSGGKLLYSDTHASFPRKLAKLVLDLKDPVAKDLMISAIPQNPNSHIEFYPANSHLSSLFSHQPYVIVGQIDEPCSFDLVIQGRHQDQWVAIKKNISFIEGRKGDRELTTQWNLQRANLCYAKFLKEGKSSSLKEAKEILKKSHADIAFE